MQYTIIGAGIGGLTTALALENKGIDYQLFERAPAFHEIGAGIWLAPNALQVLEHLGILQEVQINGNPINRILLGNSNISPFVDNSQEHIKKMFGYETVAIHRAALQKLLVDKIPKEKFHLGKEFKSFKQLDSGKILVEFQDNTSYETDFLIGADGINSKVRQQLFPESTTRYSGQTCWRGVANYTLADDFKHSALELWGNQIRFGFSQVADNKVYWFAVALDKPNQKDKQVLLQEKLLQLFNRFHPLVKELIAATSLDRIIRNDINDLKPLKHWHKDNVCLIGDAAHATTPNMGQGGAQAIEDAYYLSKLIEKHPDKNVFELFQQKRKAKVNAIVKQSWQTGKMAHWKYGTGFRNFMLKNMPNSFIEKQLMKMYTIEKTI